MKIHPDGTLEGTAEELAAYQSKVEANKMPRLWGHKPTPWEKHRSIGVQIGGTHILNNKEAQHGS